MQIRDNQERAKWILLVFYVMFFITIFAIVSGFMQYDLLNRATFTEEEGNLNDLREQIVGIVQSISGIAAAVFFIMWFRRSYFNLHSLGIRLQHSEGWAAGAWFVPILNWFRPYQIMAEIWEQTQIRINTPIQEPKILVGLWWGVWVLGKIIDRIAFRMTFRAETIEEFMNSTKAYLVSDSLSLLNLVLIILIIRKVSTWEEKLYYQSYEIPIEDHLI